MMFYACISILLLFAIMFFCLTIAIIDLETYNFGLYIVLLCIVGTMLSCALCIANPNACPNPVWYSNFCLMLQEMYPVTTDGASSPKLNGIRSMMMQASAANQSTTNPEDSKLPLRNESRATVAMLAPAVHIMHQVWKGMAWVAEGIEDEDEVTVSHDIMEQGQSTSETHSEIALKRLSTVIEHEQEELSNEFGSKNDIMV